MSVYTSVIILWEGSKEELLEVLEPGNEDHKLDIIGGSLYLSKAVASFYHFQDPECNLEDTGESLVKLSSDSRCGRVWSDLVLWSDEEGEPKITFNGSNGALVDIDYENKNGNF